MLDLSRNNTSFKTNCKNLQYKKSLISYTLANELIQQWNYATLLLSYKFYISIKIFILDRPSIWASNLKIVQFWH